MQIIPVTISNKNRSIRTNTLLDNGSNATLLTQDIVEQLDLKGKSRRLSVNNAVLKKSEVESKLVNFDLSDSHPNKLKIENAWVVSSLDVNHKNFDITNLKEKFKHLQGVPIPSLTPGGVSLIIRADFPELQIHFDFRQGDPCEPYAVKTKLGWTIMGGKNKSSQLNSNNINTSFNIDDPILLTKDEKRAVSILEKTIVLKDGHYEIGLLWKNDRPSSPYNN